MFEKHFQALSQSLRRGLFEAHVKAYLYEGSGSAAAALKYLSEAPAEAPAEAAAPAASFTSTPLEPWPEIHEGLFRQARQMLRDGQILFDIDGWTNDVIQGLKVSKCINVPNEASTECVFSMAGRHIAQAMLGASFHCKRVITGMEEGHWTNDKYCSWSEPCESLRYYVPVALSSSLKTGTAGQVAGMLAGASLERKARTNDEKTAWWLILPYSEALKDLCDIFTIPYKALPRNKWQKGVGLKVAISPFYGVLFSMYMPLGLFERQTGLVGNQLAGMAELTAVVLWERMFYKKGGSLPYWGGELPFCPAQASFKRHNWHHSDIHQIGVKAGIGWVSPALAVVLREWRERFLAHVEGEWI